MNASLQWTHVDLTEAASVAWLRDESGLDPIVAEAMIEADSRPRVLEAGNGALAILRGVNLNEGSDLEDMISVRVWVEADRVISSGRRKLRSVETIGQDLAAGTGPGTPTRFLLTLVEKLSDYIAEAADNIEARLEQLEEAGSDPAYVARNSPFSQIRRQTARIRRYLSPQREALERLTRTDSGLLNARDSAELREQINRLVLVIENLDLVRERAMVAQEEFLALVAHEQNTRMLVLAIVAAIFLPLSFLTGLMGMNVAGLPGTENPWSFAILAVLMLGIGGGVLLLFRRKKWF
jgi:zinc transporter